jgi:hypothetical protein
MVKGARRDKLDILLEQQAEIERRRKELDKDLNPLAEKIAIETENRLREDNEYLGAACRLLLAEDKTLRVRLAKQAPKVVETAKHKVKARNSLMRQLGPLPEPEHEIRPTRPEVDFARTGK